MDIIEKQISNLIKNQFPAFYQEEGPIFIQFVTEYYKWMESRTLARDEYFCEKKSRVAVKSKQANVVGSGTLFESQYIAGDKIAICKGADTNDYEIFTVNSVSNNTFLTLTHDRLPSFSLPNTRHGTVSDKPNALYYARRFLEIKDIDETLEEFIVYFKQKYLVGIQFDTQTDIRTVVKNSLDLYRSKGTERSVDLLFKLVFGVPAEVYYPARDIFRLSDGQWYQPKYLELTVNDQLDKLVSKQIFGFNSGATAFVEAVVRKKIQNKFIDVLYISAIKGVFQTGERINSSDNLLDAEDCPTVIGSLTELEIDVLGTGENFVRGDIVDIINSNNGKDGKARVLETLDTTGFIRFTLVDGGYGYSPNAEVLVSEKIVSVANVKVNANNLTNEYVHLFDRMTQPYAYLNFENSNGIFSNGDSIFTYEPNNAIRGQGTVLVANHITNTSGVLTVAILDGNLNSNLTYNAIYTGSNAIGANLNVSNSYFDMTATANVIGVTSEQYITVTSVSGDFIEDEEIYQQTGTFNNKTANGTFVSIADVISTNGIIRVTNSQGIFREGTIIRGAVSNVTANVQSIEIPIGIFNISGVLTDDPGNYVKFSSSLSNGTISAISLGSNATGEISSTMLYPEVITDNFDLLEPWVTANVAIEAAQWTLFDPIDEGPPVVYANLALSASVPIVLRELLPTENVVFGKVSALVSVNPGTGYTSTPLVKIYEKKTYPYKKEDTFELQIADESSSFSIGELITQQSSNARGIISTGSNNSVLIVKNLRFLENNYFQVSNSDSSTKIVGNTSSSTANVVSVSTSEIFDYVGLNAVVNTALRNSKGGITKVKVIDSGFGYVDGNTVILQKDDGITGDGIAIVKTLTSGTGSGYYRKTGGNLSSEKKLYDADYWQEYSYEVRSSVALEKYYQMLRQVLHVAGTKMFGAFIHNAKNTLASNTILKYNFYYLFPLGDYNSTAIFVNETPAFPLYDYNQAFENFYDCESSQPTFINTSIDLQFDPEQITNGTYDCMDYSEIIDLQNI